MAGKDEQVTVKALKIFEGAEGLKTRESEPFPVSEARAKDLEAQGLVERVGGAKAAPAAQNKMAAEPQNKGMTTDPNPEREPTNDAAFVRETGARGGKPRRA